MLLQQPYQAQRMRSIKSREKWRVNRRLACFVFAILFRFKSYDEQINEGFVKTASPLLVGKIPPADSTLEIAMYRCVWSLLLLNDRRATVATDRSFEMAVFLLIFYCIFLLALRFPRRRKAMFPPKKRGPKKRPGVTDLS